jgi:hypothetical protein
MTLPEYLDHKPIFSVKGYDKINGHYAAEGDIEDLTLGLSKGEHDERADLSIKMWPKKEGVNTMGTAHTDELSVSQVLDMAILTAQASLYMQEAYRFDKFYDPENPQVEIIGLQGNRMTVNVDTTNPTLDEDIVQFYDTINKEGELLGERYRTLKRLLDELGY